MWHAGYFMMSVLFVAMIVTAHVLRRQKKTVASRLLAFEAVVNSIAAYVFVLDPHDGTVTWQNQAAAIDLGTDLVGRDIITIISDSNREHFSAMLWPPLGQSRSYVFEAVALTTHGPRTVVFEYCRSGGQVDHIVLTGRDITDQVAGLQHEARHDALTGLLNRAGFFLATERLPRDYAVFVCDLDGLKQVNDVQGHNEGDSYIRAAAEALRSVVREGDIIARVGGDEFYIVAFGRVDFADFISRARQASARGKVSFSIGHALSWEHQGKRLGHLIEIADSLMYQDKATKKAVNHPRLKSEACPGLTSKAQ